MPFIQVTHSPGALDDVDTDDLTDALAEVASDAEGTDLGRARALTWITYDSPTEFHSSADPAVTVRALVAEGLVDDDDRETLVEGTTDVLTDMIEGLDPLATWIFIHEAPDGTIGAGGQTVSTEQIAARTGAELVEE